MKKTLLSSLIAALFISVTACSSPAPVTTTNSSAPANSAASPTSNPNSGSASTAEPKQDFTLVNQTGVEIDKVFISPHDSNEWEEDILGQDTLPNGQKVDIVFHRSQKAAVWDLRIEDKEGASIEWENLNLLTIAKVTLHLKDGKATAETE